MDLLLADKPEIVASAEGTLRLWRPARGLLVTQASGSMHEQAARVLEACIRRIVAEDGKLRGFHDWEAVSDYDATARARLMDASVQIARFVEEANFLVGSRLVLFGVQALGVVVHGVRVYPDRKSFEVALRATLQARGGRSG
jgi:hypothetical protein